MHRPLILVALGSLIPSLALAVKPFPQVEDGYPEPPGQVELEQTFTLDHHTAEGNKEKLVVKEIAVVGNGVVAIMDGAFAETLQGVVLGKSVNVQITDADHDLTDKADILKAVVEVYREKTTDELKTEVPGVGDDKKSDPHKLARFRKIDSVDVILTESKLTRPGEEEKKPETQWVWLLDENKLEEATEAPPQGRRRRRRRGGARQHPELPGNRGKHLNE